jgi:hypothetical protein
MGLFGWLDRLAGKADRKLEGTGLAMAAENAPTMAAPAAGIEIQQEEAEEQEGEGA